MLITDIDDFHALAWSPGSKNPVSMDPIQINADGNDHHVLVEQVKPPF